MDGLQREELERSLDDIVEVLTQLYQIRPQGWDMSGEGRRALRRLNPKFAEAVELSTL